MPEPLKAGNIIFCPESMQSLLPEIMLRESFAAAGVECKIVTGPGMLPQGTEIADHFCDFETAARSRAECDSIRSVCFHHDGAGAFKAFVADVKKGRAAFPQQTKLMSFFSDGFGNAIQEGSFADGPTETFSERTPVNQYLGFGFVHKTTRKLAAGVPVHILDFSLLTDFFERSEPIRKSCNLQELSTRDLDECALASYRQCCTSVFHNGVYDFGGQGEPAGLHEKLIERAKQAHGRSVKVIFRWEERPGAEADLVRKLLSQRLDAIDLDDLCGQSLTQEPLAYFLIETRQASKMTMICLDSTSFQVPAFLVRNMGPDRLDGSIDARRKYVARMTGGREFENRRFRGKTADFRERYKGFEADGLVASVTDLCESSSEVRTN